MTIVSIDNFLETTKHKIWVAWYLFITCIAIMRRAVLHDLSKYSKYEVPYFERALSKLKVLEYGSQEYKQALESLGPALEHHYACNSHHPEHWPSIYNMSLIDSIEMLCDWRAATKRHATGDFSKSLEINEKRFKYTDWTTEVFKRTAREIGLNQKAH